MQTQAGQITELLAIWREGDRAALDRLLPLIHTELFGWRGGISRTNGRTTACNLPRWCRRPSSGFYRVSMPAGVTGLIFLPPLPR
jgi:hypothetical protein